MRFLSDSAKLESLLDETAEAIILLDSRELVEYWNASAARIFGYSCEEVLDRPMPSILSKSKARKSHEALSGVPYQATGIRKDGRQFEAIVRHVLSRDPAGKQTGRAIYIREVERGSGTYSRAQSQTDGNSPRPTASAETKRDEEARVVLERLSERMQLATKSANIGVWDFHPTTGVLIWDSTMHELFGTDPDTFTGTFEDWRRCVHPEDLPATEERFSEALKGEDVFDVMFRVVASDSTVKYMKGAAVVNFLPDGSVDRVVGVNWDITAQVEVEQSLRASEDLLRDFVTHAPAAIAMLDKDMRYLQTSQRWLTDYNLQSRDIIGLCHYDVFPDIPDRWKATHQRVLAGAVEGCKEDPFPRADGSCEWLQWEARPWRNSVGEIGGVVFFTQVITARKEMELQLKAKKAELERSNNDLEQFAYAASHDLREPLRAVAGCAYLLQQRCDSQLDTEANELIQHIVDGACRMQTLIDDLLTFSRVGSNPEDWSYTETEEVLKESLLLLDATIREHEAEITCGPLPGVKANPVQLRQLFQNLIGNAIRYRSDQFPRIHLSARQVDDSWEFSVADNGIGIDQQYFSRIFRIFQRLHTRDEYPGTGIGLALCQRIVDSHGGQIWVESELGRGSVFHFTIPKKGRTFGT